MISKRKWIVALALLIGAGYLGFQQYKIYIPGIISKWREPIAENRPISWALGPATALSGKRPPYVILIVADDLGMNDISLYGGRVAGGAVPTPKYRVWMPPVLQGDFFDGCDGLELLSRVCQASYCGLIVPWARMQFEERVLHRFREL
jgi:hypothetical protein